MWKNYFNTAVRNVIKSKTFSFINISGFAAGICVVMLILYYIQFHLSFDKFNGNYGRLFRIAVMNERNGVEDGPYSDYVPAIGPEMKNDFPEVENYTRIRRCIGATYNYSGTSYAVENSVWADSSFFSLFTFNLIEGNRRTCLKEPNQIVLSKSEADKIFGSDTPLGKIILTVDNEPLTVTGVFEDVPENSDFRFGALMSMSSLYNKNFFPNFWTWRGGNQFTTFLLLKENVTQKMIEDKLPQYMWEKINREFAPYGVKFNPFLQPIEEIHLSENLKTNMYVFSVVAVLILILASINFINLNNSRSLKRNTEIGVRKVVGAGRIDIIIQFMFESFILILISTIIAAVLCYFALPVFNDFAHLDFTFSEILDTKLLAAAGLTILITCVLSSLYPSFVLSSFRPVKIFKKEPMYSNKKFSLRSILVIVQFVISIALITCTFVISRQLNFIKDKELGFDKENQLIVSLTSRQMIAENKSIKDELLKINGIVNASLSTDVPGRGVTRNGYMIDGVPGISLFNFIGADADFLSTFNLQIIKGRGFIKGMKSDENACLINQNLAEKFNWSDPIGKEINRDGRYTVIGVVKDFNFSPMYQEITPLIITNNEFEMPFGVITVKIKSDDLSGVLNSVKDVYESFSGGQPLQYSFLDETIDKVYSEELRFRSLFFYFSSIAIVIALMGIAGLTMLTAGQKKKEIAIRKVFGASVNQVSYKITKQYILMILLANIIAWPLAYMFIDKWLEQFAFKSDISPVYFILASLITLLTAIIIITYLTIKAAIANPVDSLKYE